MPQGQLAGKMATVINLMTRPPVEIWFLENPKASDVKLDENILQSIEGKTLLLLDRGFYHFSFWLKLIEHKVKKSDNSNLKWWIEKVAVPIAIALIPLAIPSIAPPNTQQQPNPAIDRPIPPSK
jgi:hypothetical protein